MKKLKELQKEFEILQSEINELKSNYNYTNGFSDEKDLDRFINENKSILKQSNDLREQIEKLEWELKTPEEQKIYLEQRNLSKLKREGKL